MESFPRHGSNKKDVRYPLCIPLPDRESLLPVSNCGFPAPADKTLSISVGLPWLCLAFLHYWIADGHSPRILSQQISLWVPTRSVIPRDEKERENHPTRCVKTIFSPDPHLSSVIWYPSQLNQKSNLSPFTAGGGGAIGKTVQICFISYSCPLSLLAYEKEKGGAYGWDNSSMESLGFPNCLLSVRISHLLLYHAKKGFIWFHGRQATLPGLKEEDDIWWPSCLKTFWAGPWHWRFFAHWDSILLTEESLTSNIGSFQPPEAYTHMPFPDVWSLGDRICRCFLFPPGMSAVIQQTGGVSIS